MKKLILLLITALSFLSASGQIFIETLEGDQLFVNPNGLSNSILFSNINASEQSIQFKTLFAFPDEKHPFHNSLLSIGLKGKPSDGIFTLFSAGNFNPSTNINASYTRIGFLGKDDYLIINGDYNVNKQSLFLTDSTFSKQISKNTFNGGAMTLSYNKLYNGKNLLTFVLGYAHKNNYSKLETLEIRDYKSIVDTTTGTTREYGQIINGKSGKYIEYDAFPMRIGYTYCPSQIASDSLKLKLGFTAYYSSEFGKNIPIHNIGTIIFLTKQNATSGVRLPIIGLGIQVNDLSNNMNKSIFLSKRVSFNITSTFNLANF